MPAVKLYTVKEAADIVGVSTNTLYKYLLEGKIKSARGTHKQGRFRIPHSALEEFLGTNISTEPTPESSTSSAIVPTPIPHTSNLGRKKLIRFLLLLCLLALILDTIISPSWTITSGILRLLLLALLITLIYRPRRVNI